MNFHEPSSAIIAYQWWLVASANHHQPVGHSLVTSANHHWIIDRFLSNSASPGCLPVAVHRNASPLTPRSLCGSCRTVPAFPRADRGECHGGVSSACLVAVGRILLGNWSATTNGSLYSIIYYWYIYIYIYSLTIIIDRLIMNCWWSTVSIGTNSP